MTRGERAVGRLVRSGGRRVSPQLSDRALGGRDATHARAGSSPARRCWRAGAATPATRPIHGSPSMRRAPPTRSTAGSGSALLGWSGNWKIHRGADGQPAGARHRRLQRFRFRLSAEARRDAGNAAPSTAASPTAASAKARAFCTASSAREILPDRAAPHLRPVLYNSWEATEFDVNEAGQTELAREGRQDRRGAVRHGRRLVRRSATTTMPAWATGS